MEKASVAILYNPHEQSKEQLIESFVVRCELFQRLFNEIKSSKMNYPEQHYLIEGQRGSGKTTLLLRLSYEIENDNDLNKWLIPVVFKEEAYYGITRLFKLWETIANILEDRNPAFSGLFEQMCDAYSEENDYERICFEMLIQSLEKERKKLILFIDNLGEMFQNFDDMESHRLREILMTCPHLRIIGATSAVLEAFFKYEHAFYEFFKKEQLRGLDKEETRKLLLELAKAYQQEEAIKSIIENQPGRVESLRILTGGVIRTIVLLFEIFIDHKEGNSISDLEKVLDRVTPLYKHRMDDLTPLQRDVVNTIALNWDAISPKEISLNTRLKTDKVSTLIRELEKVFIIQRAATNTQLHFYHLRERFFNIWYLMRLPPKGGQTKVIWLVRFLESWYTKEELAQRAKRQIQALKKGSYYPKAAYYLTEALAKTAKLDMDTEYELIRATKEYLSKKDRSLAADLSQPDKELFEQYEKFYQNKEYQQALNVLLKIKNKEEVYPYFMLLYTVLNEFDKADTYVAMIEENGNVGAIFRLGYLYQNELKDYKKAEKYYLMAVEKEHASAMYNLGLLYDEGFKDYKKAEEYYLMAVENGDTSAMYNLGLLYNEGFKDYKKAEKHYSMAVEKGHVNAMYNLGLLYDEGFKDYEKAEEYYLMAVENGDASAMYNLGLLYDEGFKDYKKAEKHYSMAVEKGHAGAMHNLAVLYFEQKKHKQEALKFSKEAVSLEKTVLHSQFLGKVYLWNDQIENSIKTINELLQDNNLLEKYTWHLNQYLMLLIAKKQYNYVTEYFETPDLNLKERFKPLYYALLYFTGDKNYHKLPPEISEPVEEIIEQIKQMEKDYA